MSVFGAFSIGAWVVGAVVTIGDAIAGAELKLDIIGNFKFLRLGGEV